jgi:hypothetical protein
MSRPSFRSEKGGKEKEEEQKVEEEGIKKILP